MVTLVMRFCIFVAVFIFCFAGQIRAADWVRAGLNTNQPVWGIRGHLLWALPPGFRGPNGLIRLCYPTLTNDNYDLINFIAIEPVVKDRKGFSELEHSKLDDRQGKRLWAVHETNTTTLTNLVPGKLSQLSNNVERLDVIVRVEPFENGAKVRLVISQRSDAPDEIKLSIHSEPGSAPMDYCILTATMGNRARTRLLWLKDEVVDSLKLYPAYKDDAFTPHTFYPLERLHRTAKGDVMAAITTDEDKPETIFPFFGTKRWHYGGVKVTQYWKKTRGTFRDDLQAIVNARYTYWQTQKPIPGGIAYENFELRERFYEGQQFIFGITKKTPMELGWK